MNCYQWYFKTNFSMLFEVSSPFVTGTAEFSWPADPTETRAMQQCGKPYYPYRPRRAGWQNCDRMRLLGGWGGRAEISLDATLDVGPYLFDKVAPEWAPDDIAFPRALAMFDYQRDNDLPNANYWRVPVTIIYSGGGFETVYFNGFKSDESQPLYGGGTITYKMSVNG